MKKSLNANGLTVSRAANLLGVSTSTLRNWDRTGKLKSVRHPVNSYRIFPLKELQQIQDAIQNNILINDIDLTSFAGSPRRPANDPDDLGQHMTPVVVGRQMIGFAQRKINDWNILDPACGDGNLLIAAAEKMLAAGITDIHRRLVGIDIDPTMVITAKKRLAQKLDVKEMEIRIYQNDFLEILDKPLLNRAIIELSEFNIVLSNPPYGRNREYKFFDYCSKHMADGTELIFLMPLSFVDRAEGIFTVPLEGRPLGVTTGHAIIRHPCGQQFSFRSIKEHQDNSSEFSVLSGIKIYELGGGNPKQSRKVIEQKPFSSATPRKGWLPCLRTGDIQPFSYETGRLYVQHGEHLAHPKELSRFEGPRVFVRRVPVWGTRQLAAVYAEETVLCAGDVLVVRHKSNDKELLNGLCVFLNSSAAAAAILERRPSIRFRDSFPKLSAKDLNVLFDCHLPNEFELRRLAKKDSRNLENEQSAKRFIEVEFPVDVVSTSSAAEKSIRQGHISTLQMWWARRPLAACRAAIFASLIPHPDELQSDDPWLNIAEKLLPGSEPLRARLNTFIGKLSEWGTATNEKHLSVARQLISAASVNVPTVLDSFAGGGSLPIEAQRLGLQAIAGDINPVAVSALKFAMTLAPQAGKDLVPTFMKAIKDINTRLTGAATKLFGKTETESPLAFFWCRIYACPECGCEVPLLKDLILSTTSRPAILDMHFSKKKNSCTFKLNDSPTKKEMHKAKSGTVHDGGALCPHCEKKTANSALQELGQANKLGERLYAVRYRDKNGDIKYRVATDENQERAATAKTRTKSHRATISVPSQQLDMNGIRHTWAIQYGVKTTSDLYNKRQGIGLLEVLHEMQSWFDNQENETISASTSLAIRYLFAFVLNRLAMYNSRHSWWQSSGEFPANMFGRQAIPFVWNYVEIPFCSESAGGLLSASDWVAKAAAHCENLPVKGQVILADAGHTGLQNESIDLVAVDPPYYDSITYGYLSDVFYVWMRELLRPIEADMFAQPVCEKSEEAIVDRPHKLAPSPKKDAHFRRKMAEAFSEIVRVLKPGGRAIVMFGHKSLKAWDAILTPLLDSGLKPIISWPIHTERKTKFKHGKIAALSSSCLMICEVIVRPRKPAIDWDEFLISHRSQLKEFTRQYRLNKLYGSDLLTAMAAPLLGLYAEYEGVLVSGKKLRAGEVFEKLPALMVDLLMTDIFGHKALIDDLIAKKWLEALQTGQENSADFPSNTNSPLLKIASEYAKALSIGDAQVADKIWTSASHFNQKAIQNIMEGVSLFADPNSELCQIAHGCLGRISLSQRGQDQQ